MTLPPDHLPVPAAAGTRRDGRRAAAAVLAAGFTGASTVLAGCAAGGGAVPPAVPLAGTSWQLVRFQSMDDAKGTTRIADPTLYVATFGADGRVSLRLDCNRATGEWRSTPSADGSSGTLRFGPLAGTRALCPPPSIGETLLRDLDAVRSYRLHDGELHLALQADAGLYSWRPLRAP